LFWYANGCVSNYKELEAQNGDKFGGPFAVDSQYIFAHLAHERPTTTIDGWGALQWWEWRKRTQQGIEIIDPPKIKFLRFNMDSFSIARLKDDFGLIWCSEQEPISRACRMARLEIDFFYTLEAEKEYFYTATGLAQAAKNNTYPLMVGEKRIFGYRSWGANRQWPEAASKTQAQVCYSGINCLGLFGAKPKNTSVLRPPVKLTTTQHTLSWAKIHLLYSEAIAHTSAQSLVSGDIGKRDRREHLRSVQTEIHNKTCVCNVCWRFNFAAMVQDELDAKRGSHQP
jgi:hypothetical protein